MSSRGYGGIRIKQRVRVRRLLLQQRPVVVADRPEEGAQRVALRAALLREKMNTPVREGETIEGSRTMRNRPYQVLKCSSTVRGLTVRVGLVHLEHLDGSAVGNLTDRLIRSLQTERERDNPLSLFSQ